MKHLPAVLSKLVLEGHSDLATELLSSSSCPLRTKAYGGLPSSGGYVAWTEYEIGAQRIAEASHCILGSMGGDHWFEPGHIRDELDLIERTVEEYSKRLYSDRLLNYNDDDIEFVEGSVKSIGKASPKLRARAQKLKAEVERQEDIPQKVKTTALLTYDVVIELTNAMEHSVRSWPKKMENAFQNRKLRQSIRNLRHAVDAMVRDS